MTDQELIHAHIEKYNNFFPEGFAMDHERTLPNIDHDWRLKIYKSSPTFTRGGHAITYTCRENGHIILYEVGDLDIMYGSLESLKYFADKYITIEKY